MDEEKADMICQVLESGRRMLHKIHQGGDYSSGMWKGLGLPQVKSREEMDLDLWCRIARLRLKVTKGKLSEEEAQLEAQLIAEEEFVRRCKNLTRILNFLTG